MTVLDRLKDAVGPKGFSEDPAEIAPHLEEWRSKYRGHTTLLLKPATTAEVSAALRICNETGTPVVTQGGPWAAALHAGWRGATAGILRRGVAVYRDLGGEPGRLVWALGPAILRCHFEVGEEVLAAARRDPAWREDLAEPGPRGRPHLDLHGFLRAQALDLGLDAALDGSVPRCTLCEPALLNSFRGGAATARQWGWIRLQPTPPVDPLEHP